MSARRNPKITLVLLLALQDGAVLRSWRSAGFEIREVESMYGSVALRGRRCDAVPARGGLTLVPSSAKAPVPQND